MYCCAEEIWFKTRAIARHSFEIFTFLVSRPLDLRMRVSVVGEARGRIKIVWFTLRLAYNTRSAGC